MEIQIIDTANITDEEYNNYKAIVSKNTVTRTERMRFDTDKRSTIAGEAAAKLMLSKKRRIPARDILFFVSDRGKPYIKDNLYFNISHSSGMVAIAVHETEIGIDIEKIRSFDERILDRVCTQNEKNYILSAKTESEKNERFFTIWTLKEAYFKCIGTGIAVDLKSAEFQIKDGEVIFHKENFTAVTSVYNNHYIISVVYFTSP